MEIVRQCVLYAVYIKNESRRDGCDESIRVVLSYRALSAWKGRRREGQYLSPLKMCYVE